MGCGDIQMTFWSLVWDLMAHGVLGHRVFCWHLVGSCQNPYHIIRECTYTCDSQWECYSCCILGTFIGTPFCSIALDRIFELLDCTQRHHLKESKDTHGNNNSKNKPIINNRSTVSDIQYEVVEKQLWKNVLNYVVFRIDFFLSKDID